MPNSNSTIDDLRAPSMSAAPRLVVGRYRLAHRLGMGGMGEVFLAHDQQTAQAVAVKFLLRHQVNQVSRLRFQREIRHLQELRHPNIIAILDTGEDEDRPFLVMEYVDGDTLRAFYASQPNQRLPLESFKPVFLPLLQALGYMHHLGIIHRDLKPHNVMLMKPTTDDALTLKLMDFGLARREAGTQLTETGLTVGTLDYMSPEQITGQRLDARSDLYSLGVMLYEAAAGQLPFVSSESTGVLFQHLQIPPLPPRQHNPVLPPALEQLVLKLLEKEPAQRYASAEAVAQALETLTEAPVTAEFVFTPTHDERPRYLWQSPWVGRAAELARAGQLLEATLVGKPMFLAIASEGGAGKTRYAEELLKLARLRGGRVLHTLCHRQSGVALEPVVAIVRQLRPPTEWATLPPTDIQILARLLPELHASLPTDLPPLPTLPAKLEQARLYDCVARLMLAEAQPSWVMLMVEDLHWADEGTLGWLAYLTRRVVESGARVWVCGSLSIDPEKANPPLEGCLHDLTHAKLLNRIDLPLFDVAGVTELLTAWLGAPLPALAEFLFGKTRGNALFVSELLRALLETEKLKRGDDGWEWDLTGLTLPMAVTEVVQERLNRLSEPARRALSMAALLGREFDFDVLAAALVNDLSEDQLIDASEEWLTADLARDLPADRFAFAHGLAQDVAATELRGVRLSRAHRRLAEALETRRAPRLADYYEALARHWEAGGDMARALTYALQAGLQAAARSAYASAAAFFRDALRLGEGLPATDPEPLAQVRFALGNALEHTGDYVAAAEAFSQAALGPFTLTRPEAEVRRRQARVLGLHGHYAEALALLASAKALTHADPALAARLDIQTAALFYWQGELAQAEAHLAPVVATLHATAHQRELAEGLNLLGVLQEVSGQPQVAIDTYQDSLRLWRELRDDFQSVRTQENLAGALYFIGRLPEAIQQAETALAYWLKLGDPSQVASAQNNLGEFYLALGDLAAAEKNYAAARESLVRLNNPRLIVITTFNLARVRLEQGELVTARWYAEIARDLAHEAQTDDYLAEGFRVLAQIYAAQGDWSAAQTAGQEALRRAQAQGLQLDEATAERVLGEVALHLEQITDARAHLERSAQSLRALNLPLHLGRSLAALARWHHAHGQPTEAEALATEARQLFEALGAQHELEKLAA